MKYKALNLNSFGTSLIKWYQESGRSLPWRETTNPYKIWVSEIILQQTRVEQGLPYFEKFLENFSNLKSLSDASERDVLKVWEGLGYYSRARNMHKCSRVIVKEYGGIFPEEYDELLKLPGIGKYTAAAIASFAYKKKVPAIDSNVIRVLTRVLRIPEDPAKSSVSRKLFDTSLELISENSPDLYNQGMMELGSQICKPVSPKCNFCPISDFCESFLKGDQELYPFKKQKKEVRKRYFNYVILKSGDKVYFQLRGDNDIWKGLYEFLLIESTGPIDLGEVLDQVPGEVLEKPEVIYESGEVKHLLSHQEIRARFFEIETFCKDEKPTPYGKMFKRHEIEDLPKSVLISKYLEDRPI